VIVSSGLVKSGSKTYWGSSSWMVVEADGSVSVWVGVSISARLGAVAGSGAEREECWSVDMLFAVEKRCRPVGM
jgi:hypothetical protein